MSGPKPLPLDAMNAALLIAMSPNTSRVRIASRLGVSETVIRRWQVELRLVARRRKRGQGA